MKMGQTIIITDSYKMNDFLGALIEYKPKDVEHIVPQEMIDMHDKKKTKAE